MTTKQFKSDLMASVHESAEALAKVGAIDKATLRGFDKLCIAKAPDFESAQIKKLTPPHPFEAYSHVLSPIDARDGGGFMFTMPDIPGVVADGETMDEAMADGREAFESTVSALLDMGREVPAPASSSLAHQGAET